MTNFGNFSRYRSTPKIIEDGKETIGVWKEPSYIKTKPSDSNIGVYQVRKSKEGRPDLIANQLYGNTKLSWVLIAFNAAHYNNGARNSLNWPLAGTTIYYPVESIVFPALD